MLMNFEFCVIPQHQICYSIRTRSLFFHAIVRADCGDTIYKSQRGRYAHTHRHTHTVEMIDGCKRRKQGNKQKGN